MRRVVSFAISGALHALMLLMLLARAPLDTADVPTTIVVEQVSPDVIASPDQQLPAPDDDADERLWEASMLKVDEFAFDIAKIRTRMNTLFPFLTLELAFLDRVAADLRQSQQRLTNPLSRGGHGLSATPLDTTDEGLQEITDRAWSRRARWAHFAEIVALTSTHHPSQGRLPEVIRHYLDQNILQPYCDGDKHDPRYWAMLENAADHADFIDFIRSYARTYPSSKTTTELLFLLDELAQGSRDVILMVMETRPDEHLAFTRTRSPEAYDLAMAVKERYGRWLLERGMDKSSVRRHFNELRLQLLRTIVETTPAGYRVADAKFLAGQVLFEMGRLGEAGHIWSTISPVEGDAYHRDYTELLDELTSSRPLPRVLQRILQAEYGRWRVFSIDRLREFGHHCDTF